MKSEFTFMMLFLAAMTALSIVIQWLIRKLRLRERLGLARKD